MNTSIIISELSRDDFIKAEGETMSLVDKLKLEILNIDKDGDEDYFLSRISTWSNLPFLGRTIVILKDEESSQQLYDHLTTNLRAKLGLNPQVKITLQANLLSRTKSFDGINDENLLVEDLRKFKDYHHGNLPEDIKRYNEPEPQKFDFRDLNKLGMEVEPQDAAGVPQKSVDDFELRPRSNTKTIFKPSLSLNTNVSTQESMPSPTITLEESN